METNIAVTEKNAPRINRLIDSIEGSSKVRPLTFDQIREVCTEAEQTIPVSKVDLMGTEIFVDVNAGKCGPVYNDSPMSTQFRAVKTATGWKLTEITRDYCWKTKNRGTFKFSEKTRNALIEKFLKLE